jgi:spore germination cell wall hydrolase CwlJ-like protein
MKTYIRIFLFMIALAVSTVAVTWTTKFKLSDLRAQALVETPQFATVKDRERQLKCMADNIYYEAATEPAEGKIAVAQVVMNRVNHPKFPSDPCLVIYERNVFYQKVVCQFSWLCDGSVGRRPIQPKLYEESMQAAKKVLLEGFRLPGLEGAIFYHADYVNPRWRKTQLVKIGRHIFYKERTNESV